MSSDRCQRVRWLAVWVLMLVTRSVVAAPVAVLAAPADPPPAELELVQQLTAELVAEGMEVVVLMVPDRAADGALQRALRQTGGFAAVRCLSDGALLAAEVRIESTKTGTRLFRVEGHGAEALRTVALQVVEFLRASLLELPPAPADAVPPAAAPVEQPHTAPWSRAAPAAERSFVAGIGAGLVLHPGGLPPGVAPSVSLAWCWSPSWLVELRLITPVLGVHRDETLSAHIDQELGQLGLRWSLLHPERLGVALGLGVGIYRLGGRGDAMAPYAETQDAAVSGIASLGMLFSWRLTANESFALDALTRIDSMVLTRPPALRFANRAVARAGQPMVVAALGLEASW